MPSFSRILGKKKKPWSIAFLVCLKGFELLYNQTMSNNDSEMSIDMYAEVDKIRKQCLNVEIAKKSWGM